MLSTGCEHRTKLAELMVTTEGWVGTLGALAAQADCSMCRLHFSEARDVFMDALAAEQRVQAQRAPHALGLCCREQTRWAYLCNALRSARDRLQRAARAFDGAGDQRRAWVYRAAWRATSG